MKNKIAPTAAYFLNKYKTYCAIMLLSFMTVAFFESLSIAMIIPVINSILGISDKLSRGNVILRVVDYIRSFAPIEDKVVITTLLFLAVTILKGVSKVGNEWVMAYSSGKILYDTKKAMMEKLAQEEYQYFLNNKQGEVSYRLLNATTKVGTLIFKTAQLISELFTIAAISVLLFILNIYAALVCITIGFLFSIFIGMVAKNISYVLGKGRLESASGQAVTFNEFFNGIKQITIFDKKGPWLSKFDAYSKLFTRLYIKDYIWLAMPTNLIEVFGISALLVTFLVLRAHTGGVVISYLPLAGVFAVSLLKALPALGTIGTARMLIVGSLSDSEAVVRVLTAPSKKPAAGKVKFRGFNSSIEFNRVSFDYDRGGCLFTDLKFSIKKNETTAIVGTSGTGKTTVVNLLLGLFAPSKGRIMIDGVDLREYDIESFRKKIGFVSQDSFLFHSTIFDNITFCSNEYSEADVIEAAKLANIHEFIMSLRDGYKTIVGERGSKLSGGQQQRLAIARALIRKPEILILDEATSSLDAKSEEEVHRAISGLAHKYTVIMIAHRLSTLKGADRVLVLEGGAISTRQP